MNAASVSAWFEANKKPVMIVAGAGAVGLGLMRARKATAKSGGEPAPGPLSAGTAFATGPAIAGTVPYDSSQLDAYNDLQSQILGLYDAQAAANAPVPVPVQEGYYGRAGGTGIYYVDAAGNRDWLDMPEYLAMTNGHPESIPVAQVSKDSSFWTNTKAVGEDHGTWTK